MTDKDFFERRQKAQEQINRIDRDTLETEPQRDKFFDAVYRQAEGDAAMVPWADMAAKHKLRNWLLDNPGKGKRAVDVGCGLGDNAEALAKAGYQTTGFDFSKDAIDWAKQRFPKSGVTYQTADLFDLPEEWSGAFDLVHECYTLQSIPPETLEKTIPATANLVAPNGILLLYARVREDGQTADGPPWPVEKSKLQEFAMHGLTLENMDEFSVERQDRSIPHYFMVWRRTS